MRMNAMHEAGNSSSAASYSTLRLAALRVLAAAHVVVGFAELSRVAGNLLLQESYMGGPMGLFGALTIQFVKSSIACSWYPRRIPMRSGSSPHGSCGLPIPATHSSSP